VAVDGVDGDDGAQAHPAEDWVTIDRLAAACGTTSRRVRSFQTLGLLPYPALRGRTGLYGRAHRERLAAILRLQAQGFSLESLGVLFDALAAGRSLAEVVGEASWNGELPAAPDNGDDAERYGFAELQRVPALSASTSPRRRPLLSVVPTTVWDESQAS
jgi:DNA-binding transcriptional MerR regulator